MPPLAAFLNRAGKCRRKLPDHRMNYSVACSVASTAAASLCRLAEPLALAPPSRTDWRVRVLLWPDSDECEPLCVKMRGQGGDVTDYGRTATCT